MVVQAVASGEVYNVDFLADLEFEMFLTYILYQKAELVVLNFWLLAIQKTGKNTIRFQNTTQKLIPVTIPA